MWWTQTARPVKHAESYYEMINWRTLLFWNRQKYFATVIFLKYYLVARKSIISYILHLCKFTYVHFREKWEYQSLRYYDSSLARGATVALQIKGFNRAFILDKGYNIVTWCFFNYTWAMFWITEFLSLIVSCTHLSMGGVAPNCANVALTGRDFFF